MSVLGYTPWKREVNYLKEIGMVMGNKSQIPWDNTIMDYYHVIKAMYKISNTDFKKRLDEFDDILDISQHFKKFARNLSLGERMKCELVSALLHNPKVIFLDEPTLGLDVTMQLRMRKFITQYNKRHNSTIILTSHYMGDITSLCKRVVMINQGRILYDGELAKLSNKISPYKLIKITFNKKVNNRDTEIYNLHNSNEDFKILNSDENSITIRTKKEKLSSIVGYIMNNTSLIDLSIVEPPIEDVIDQIYNEFSMINI